MSNFLHDDPEFPQLIRIVRASVPLDVEFIEKDYWVTHVLWWLQREGFTVCFKGGTSLSKCFGLIQRFSEDIDLLLVAPQSLGLPPVAIWDPRDYTSASDRLVYFRALATVLERVPGIVRVRYDESRHADRHVNALFFLDYQPHFSDGDRNLLPAVQLELAPDAIYARTQRPVTSFVHDNTTASSRSSYENNRPLAMDCAHPIATLLGKLDAICNQHRRHAEPTKYIRHFEDAHHIIQAIDVLPPPPDGTSVRDLARRMLADGQIRRAYDAEDDAFSLPEPDDRADLERAHASLTRWHRGPRVSLMTACSTIRDWLVAEDLFAEL